MNAKKLFKFTSKIVKSYEGYRVQVISYKAVDNDYCPIDVSEFECHLKKNDRLPAHIGNLLTDLCDTAAKKNVSKVRILCFSKSNLYIIESVTIAFKEIE